MTNPTQVNVKLDPELNRWLESAAGGARARAEFVRALIERERTRAEDAKLRDMFAAAARELDADELAERESLIDGYAGRGL